MVHSVPLIEATRKTIVHPRLAQAAKETTTLLGEILAVTSPLDLLVGAIHSFYMAKEFGYKNRPSALGPKYHARLTTRASSLARATICTDGRWLAGYYFNSALLRIAASYHQTLKAITGQDKYVPALILLVSPAFRHASLDEVHREVNRLKHGDEGIDPGRSVTFDQAVDALGELIDLIRAQKAQILGHYPNP